MTVAQAKEQGLLKRQEKKGKNKYGNKKTEYNGRTYDSQHEAHVSRQLDLLKKAKGKDKIIDIQYQVRYKMSVNKKHICTYIADFVVTYADKRVEVIDAKGFKTAVYKLKKKLMKAVHNIDIAEM